MSGSSNGEAPTPRRANGLESSVRRKRSSLGPSTHAGSAAGGQSNMMVSVGESVDGDENYFESFPSQGGLPSPMTAIRYLYLGLKYHVYGHQTSSAVLPEEPYSYEWSTTLADFSCCLASLTSCLFGISTAKSVIGDSALEAYKNISAELITTLLQLPELANPVLFQEYSECVGFWKEFRFYVGLWTANLRAPGRGDEYLLEAFFSVVSAFDIFAQESGGTTVQNSIKVLLEPTPSPAVTPELKTPKGASSALDSPSLATNVPPTPLTSSQRQVTYVTWCILIPSVLLTIAWLIGEIVTERYSSSIAPLVVAFCFFAIATVLAVASPGNLFVPALLGYASLLWVPAAVAVVDPADQENGSDVTAYNYPFYVVFYPAIGFFVWASISLTGRAGYSFRRTLQTLPLVDRLTYLFVFCSAAAAIVVRVVFLDRLSHNQSEWQATLEIFHLLVCGFAVPFFLVQQTVLRSAGPTLFSSAARFENGAEVSGSSDGGPLGFNSSLPPLLRSYQIIFDVLREGAPSLDCTITFGIVNTYLLAAETAAAAGAGTTDTPKMTSRIGSMKLDSSSNGMFHLAVPSGKASRSMRNSFRRRTNPNSPVIQNLGSQTTPGAGGSAATANLNFPALIRVSSVPYGKIVLAGNRLCPGGEELIETVERTIWRAPLIGGESSFHVAVNSQGKVFSWPRAASLLTGIPPHEVLGRSLVSLFVSSAHQSLVQTMIQSASEDRAVPPARNLSIVGDSITGGYLVDVMMVPAKSLTGRPEGAAVLIKVNQRTQESLLPFRESFQRMRKELGASHPLARRLLVMATELQAAIQQPSDPLSLQIALDIISKGDLRQATWKINLEDELKTAMILIDGPYVTELLRPLCAAVYDASLIRTVQVDGVIVDVGDKKSTVSLSISPLKAKPGISTLTGRKLGASDLDMGNSLRSASMGRTLSPTSQQGVSFVGNPYEDLVTVQFDEAEPIVHVDIPYVVAFSASGPGGLASPRNVPIAMPTFNAHEGHMEIYSGRGAPDPVRCTVLLLDYNYVTLNTIRATLLRRGHFVASVSSVDELRVGVEKVDAVICRLPLAQNNATPLFRGATSSGDKSVDSAAEMERASLDLEQFLETRPGLHAIAVVGADYRIPFEASLFSDKLSSDFLLSDLNPVIDRMVEHAQKQKVQDRTIQEVKLLLTQQKTCPWTKGRLLGKGTFATVYEATNNTTGGKMAVRMIPIASDDPAKAQNMMQRIIEEVRVMSRLEHPNIIQYLYCEREGNLVHIFTELAPRGSLRNYLNSKGRQPESRIAEWMEQVLSGLAYLHGEKIVHCDLKCDNILLTRTGCKLADFGTAKPMVFRGAGKKGHLRGDSMSQSQSGESSSMADSAMHPSEPAPSGLEGTMLFMAPEVLTDPKGGVPHWTVDVWALGCVLMEMATGGLPWAHVSSSPLACVGYVSELASSGEAPKLPPYLSENVRSMMEACLQVNPKQRPSCQDLLEFPLITAFRDDTARRMSARKSFNVQRHGSTSENSTGEDSSDERRESCFSQWSAVEQPDHVRTRF
jgi:serine/threonine protein kinase